MGSIRINSTIRDIAIHINIRKYFSGSFSLAINGRIKNINETINEYAASIGLLKSCATVGPETALVCCNCTLSG